MSSAKIGILLTNLGTPDAPTPSAVYRYLNQFLTDPRVIDLPRWKWIPLLRTLILPKRSKRVAQNYQSIWTEEGSPLLQITKQQQRALQTYLDNEKHNTVVEIAMTYGNPSMESAVKKLIDLDVEKIIVLPLYPQYSSTTTASVFDAFAAALRTTRKVLPFEFIHAYHTDKHYIAALAESIKVRFNSDEFLQFSYHGIPERYETLGDYYREHCKQTTLAVVDYLGLTENQWGMSFQSRFGKEEWLQPYTDETLAQYPKQGILKLAVICPGFAADCLETLEEIAEENKTIFLQAGGQSYQYIPALNAEHAHIKMMAELIKAKMYI